MRAIAVWQSTQPQDQPSNSSPQSSPAQPPTDQQAARDQSSAPPQPPAVAASPCPQKSQPGSTTTPDCNAPEATEAKTSKHGRTRNAEAPAGTAPTKTVVRNGSATDPTVDLSPGVSQRESTNQLLTTSEQNLKKLSERQLSATQQDTVKQIKGYIEQANTAAKGGDVQRAHNLAIKANALTETIQLLAPSETNLQKISGRQLNANQQDTVKQIQSFMEQATTAARDGDVQRAHNLAVKANLLSAELVGH
jgi:homogentisate 1,2-dioxygenase